MKTLHILYNIEGGSPNIKQYNLFEFIELLYDYISSNSIYKPYKVEIRIAVKSKPNMEVIPIMYSYSFSKDILYQQLALLKIILKRRQISYNSIHQVYITLTVKG